MFSFLVSASPMDVQSVMAVCFHFNCIAQVGCPHGISAGIEG